MATWPLIKRIYRLPPPERLLHLAPRRAAQPGHTLPFDREDVTHLWFDALLNDLTAASYLVDDERSGSQRAGVRHQIGQDILTTHGVDWSTMLHTLGLP